MSLSLAQLRQHLAGDVLKPVYFLAGEEHLLLIEAADALRARARALGYLERDVLDAEAGFDWNDLARAASGMSLFASRKLIDLRVPTGKPNKDGAAAIIEYCQRPPPDTVLLITSTQWSKQHHAAWVDEIESVGVFVPIATLRPGDEGLGLTHVLLHIGVPSVVAGVARVRDDVAAVVMQRVHEEMAHGAGSAEALAAAQAEFGDGSAPAPFVTFGGSW